MADNQTNQPTQPRISVGNWITIIIFILGLAISWGNFKGELQLINQKAVACEIDFKEHIKYHQGWEGKFETTLQEISKNVNAVSIQFAKQSEQLKNIQENLKDIKVKQK